MYKVYYNDDQILKVEQITNIYKLTSDERIAMLDAFKHKGYDLFLYGDCPPIDIAIFKR
jgi:hypothetical protein